MLVVAFSFKGMTINTKMRLNHELLSSPETRILKWFGYKSDFSNSISIRSINAPLICFVLIKCFTVKSPGYQNDRGIFFACWL